MATNISLFDLEIANIALSITGVPSIDSLSDTTTEAQTCNARIESCRNYILSAYKWMFLLKRAEIDASVTVTPIWGFEKAFKLPTDFVTVLQILDTNLEPITSFQILDDHIQSDEEETIYLLYYSNNYQTNKVPAYFKEMAGAYLADQVSHKLNPQERPRISQNYLMAKDAARKAELRNQPPQFYAKHNSKYIN